MSSSDTWLISVDVLMLCKKGDSRRNEHSLNRQSEQPSSSALLIPVHTRTQYACASSAPTPVGHFFRINVRIK